MITRGSFIAIIDAIQVQIGFDRKIGKAVDVLSTGDVDGLNNHPFVYTTPLIDRLLEILAVDMNDAEGYLDWWAFDGPDWGRRADDFRIHLPDGTDVAIRTAGELYDFIGEPS